MLINAFVIIFVGAFIALAALGHVLLATAIWPKLLATRDAKHGDGANAETPSTFDGSAKAV